MALALFSWIGLMPGWPLFANRLVLHHLLPQLRFPTRGPTRVSCPRALTQLPLLSPRLVNLGHSTWFSFTGLLRLLLLGETRGVKP